MIPWERDELVENSKSSRTTRQSMRSSLKTSEEVDDPRTRTSNFQQRSGWRGEWRRGGARVNQKRGEVGGIVVKSETDLLFYSAEGGKRKLPGWTGQTSLTDRSDQSHPECEKTVVQSVRGKLRTIRTQSRLSELESRQSRNSS